MSLQIRTSNQSLYHRHHQCLLDVKESLKLWRLACSMAWLDIKLRYKGSLLGPLWMTCTSGIMIATMGLIYGSLFGSDMHLYLPYLSISIILWQNIFSATIVDACQSFLQTDTFIHSLKLPFFLQALRTVIKNIIIFILNIIIPILVFIYYHKWPGITILLSIPGFFIWFLDSLAVCLLLGSICARFRDIPQIINSAIQILYYVTPIMWMPSQIQHFQSLLLLNPIFSIMQTIKAPILGENPSLLVWYSALGYSVILWTAGWFTFIHARNRLAFWI